MQHTHYLEHKIELTATKGGHLRKSRQPLQSSIHKIYTMRVTYKVSEKNQLMPCTIDFVKINGLEYIISFNIETRPEKKVIWNVNSIS